MVYDREALEKTPRVSFSYMELEAILEAAKGDSDVKKSTIDKLKILMNYARTKNAYGMGNTTISAK